MMQLNAPAGMAPAGCILARFFKKFLLHWDVTKVLLEPRRLAVKNSEIVICTNEKKIRFPHEY